MYVYVIYPQISTYRKLHCVLLLFLLGLHVHVLTNAISKLDKAIREPRRSASNTHRYVFSSDYRYTCLHTHLLDQTIHEQDIEVHVFKQLDFVVEFVLLAVSPTNMYHEGHKDTNIDCPKKPCVDVCLVCASAR